MDSFVQVPEPNDHDEVSLFIALLWGIGFSSLVSLLMNLNWVIGILLFPGGLATAVLPKSRLDPMALLFAANVTMYSLAAFAAVFLFFCNARSVQRYPRLETTRKRGSGVRIPAGRRCQPIFPGWKR